MVRNRLAIAGMALAQVPMLLLALWLLGLFPPAALLTLFLVPGPTFVIAGRWLRRHSTFDAEVKPSDWGHTRGHAWVVVDGAIHFVDEPTHERLVATPLEPGRQESHSGFETSVPVAHLGIPRWWTLSLWCWLTLIGPFLPIAIGLGAYLSSAAPLILGLLLYAVVCAPWVASTASRENVHRRTPRTPVTLNGRAVRTPDGAFMLGQPGEVLDLDDGVLTLTNDAEKLQIPGAAASLTFLHQAFERASAGSGDRTAIPDAIRGLREKA